jgi:hypothetical protein
MGRRLRGLLGIATTWGVALAALATTVLAGGIAIGVVPTSVFGLRQVIAVAIQNFIVGAFAGSVFSLLFAGAERKRSLATVSMPRVALWGFLGVAIPVALTTATASVLYRVPLSVAATGILVAGVMGSAMSTATIKLARRAPALPDVPPSDVDRLPPGVLGG